MNPMAVPPIHDVPLPLPAPSILLQALLVVLFLGHILFVNLMVGGSLLVLYFEARGRRRPELDRLAHEIAHTVTVNKSLAVVLGVGPLLGINVLYTVYWYTANSLTGSLWIMIVPLVTLAFLVTYLHKYTWERLRGTRLHLAIGAVAAGLFLSIPLIFLSNINLMLFPGRWLEVRGFWHAVLLANVWPRYLHFLIACLAITSLFLVLWLTRAGFPLEQRLGGLDRPALRRRFYNVALGASALQLVFGPLNLLTLPREGLSLYMYAVFGVGLTLGLSAMAVMLREIRSPHARPNRRFVAIFLLLTLTAFTMGYGRHVYRETAVMGHRTLMAERTHAFGWSAGEAAQRAALGIGKVEMPLGQQIFTTTCSACHAVDHVLVGPALTEIARIYADNPGGIADWAAAPGRKRPDFPAMPAFDMGRQKLMAVARYMLDLAADGTAQPPAPGAPGATPGDAGTGPDPATGAGSPSPRNGS